MVPPVIVTQIRRVAFLRCSSAPEHRDGDEAGNETDESGEHDEPPVVFAGETRKYAKHAVWLTLSEHSVKSKSHYFPFKYLQLLVAWLSTSKVLRTNLQELQPRRVNFVTQIPFDGKPIVGTRWCPAFTFLAQPKFQQCGRIRLPTSGPEPPG